MPVGGQVPVEVEVVGRSGCKGSWWANGGPGKVGGECFSELKTTLGGLHATFARAISFFTSS